MVGSGEIAGVGFLWIVVGVGLACFVLGAVASYRIDNWWEAVDGRMGYVYLMRRRDGLYKIGRTGRDPRERLEEIEREVGMRVRLLAKVRCRDMYACESALHRRYARRRRTGEWFDLDGRQFSVRRRWVRVARRLR